MAEEDKKIDKRRKIKLSDDGEKYHFSCRYLPHDFESKPSDNKSINHSGNFPFSMTDFGIQPKPEFLGMNKCKKTGGHSFSIGEVYVIHAIGTTLFKIGMTTNFSKRFTQITGASPLPLNVVKYGMCDNPHILEKHLHKLFEDKRFKNEWFHLTKDDLCKVDGIFDKYFERTPKNERT